MQSKRSKLLLMAAALLALAAFAAAMLHEPELKQTAVEQALDAQAFGK